MPPVQAVDFALTRTTPEAPITAQAFEVIDAVARIKRLDHAFRSTGMVAGPAAWSASTQLTRCRCRYDSAKAPKWLNAKKLGYGLHISGFGGEVGKLVCVELGVWRACDALPNLFPRLRDKALKIASHHGATTKPINRLILHQTFMPGIVYESRQASALQD
jgi:hypothetical protein